MRCPFGPPHLTLNPPQKTEKNKKNIKWAFQLSVIFGGCPKFPFLTTWPKKRAPQKHYKNWVFSKPFFLKKTYASRNGYFWTKKPKSRNSSYHLFCLSLLFKQQHKSAETLFLKCFGQHRQENFQNLNLKKRKKILAHFFEKAISRKLPYNWAQKKHKMITECANICLKPL